MITKYDTTVVITNGLPEGTVTRWGRPRVTFAALTSPGVNHEHHASGVLSETCGQLELPDVVIGRQTVSGKRTATKKCTTTKNV